MSLPFIGMIWVCVCTPTAVSEQLLIILFSQHHGKAGKYHSPILQMEN